MLEISICKCRSLFFFNDTATTEIYTLSLHDALPISWTARSCWPRSCHGPTGTRSSRDRKSTRLNSSHSQISYAVFCLKKKKIHSRTSELYYVQQRMVVIHCERMNKLACALTAIRCYS